MDLSGILAVRFLLAGAVLWLLTGCAGVVAAPDVAALPTLASTALAPYLSPTPPAIPAPRTAVPTPLPTATGTVTPTPPPPPPTATPTPEPTSTPDPARVINGVAFDDIAPIPPDVAAHVREIHARGLALGRNPRAFSKMGDSGVLVESYLTRFDKGSYNLGPYAMLQPAVDHYAGSFERYGAGARVALTTIGVFDPMWANPQLCNPGETLLACEIRLHNPGLLLIRLGTNDGNSARFEQYLRDIVTYSLENGVIPVIGTKADRFEGGDDRNNQAMRRVAAEMRVPLWDFDRLADTLPGRGLRDDNAHLTAYRNNDYTDPETYSRGYPMSDLSALIVLETIRQVIGEDAP
jgi:hypothetical protein